MAISHNEKTSFLHCPDKGGHFFSLELKNIGQSLSVGTVRTILILENRNLSSQVHKVH